MNFTRGVCTDFHIIKRGGNVFYERKACWVMTHNPQHKPPPCRRTPAQRLLRFIKYSTAIVLSVIVITIADNYWDKPFDNDSKYKARAAYTDLLNPFPVAGNAIGVWLSRERTWFSIPPHYNWAIEWHCKTESNIARGISAAGSARHWQCRGQGFESPMLHSSY